MKWILACLSFGLFGFGLSGSAPKQTAKEVTVIISGGARGQLSPCGCTKPMSGGLKRLATVVRELKSRSNVVWIDSGDIIDAPGRQSQMKAETYSELMGVLGVDVVAYTSNDQRQGLGLLVAGTSLSKRKWLGVEPDRSMPIVAESIKSGITISVANEQVLKFEAEREAGIVILDGKRESISLLQKPHEMVVFASEGIPTVNGSAVSPGSHLRGVVIATFRDNRFVSAKVVSLDPSIKDDPKGKKIFGSYLTRITQERLIDSTVKDIDHDFAGSAVCGNCHGKLR